MSATHDADGMPKRPPHKCADCPKGETALFLNINELVELDEALATKINYIGVGRFGPENAPGEDRRWMDDLKAIKAKVRAAMQEI